MKTETKTAELKGVKLALGDVVEICDDFTRRSDGSLRVVCRGTVSRFTKTLVIVDNEHGNERRFYLKDGRCVGYAWPYVTSIVRRANQTVTL